MLLLSAEIFYFDAVPQVKIDLKHSSEVELVNYVSIKPLYL